MIWTIIHIIDIFVWIIITCSVGYVAFFAFISLKKKNNAATSAIINDDTRFAVIFPAYNEDIVIRNSIEHFLTQDYPTSLYTLAVVSDHMQDSTNEWLATHSLLLLQPVFEKSSKAKALQYAIEQLEGYNYSHIVILDADNIVEPNFLSRLNIVCKQGHRVIQCHRTAKNSDNNISALDGVSEEINNTIFRRAHNIIGLSSALIGSGMCFEAEWFKSHVNALSTAVEDRELEAQLLKERVHIHYEDDILVMDEKVSSQDNFQRQRLRWMTGQIQSLISMLPYIPKAICELNIDYIDKTIQQMLIPRSILILTLPLLSLIITVVNWQWSIKWWTLLCIFFISIFIAIPSQLRSIKLLTKLTSLPSLAWRMVTNIFHIRTSDTSFSHTTHDK